MTFDSPRHHDVLHPEIDAHVDDRYSADTASLDGGSVQAGVAELAAADTALDPSRPDGSTAGRAVEAFGKTAVRGAAAAELDDEQEREPADAGPQDHPSGSGLVEESLGEDREKGKSPEASSDGGGDGDDGNHSHDNAEDGEEDPDRQRMRIIVEGSSPRPPVAAIEVRLDAPDGIVVPNHLTLAPTELTASQIDRLYDTGMRLKAVDVPPEAANVWRKLELTLSEATAANASPEALHGRVDRALAEMDRLATDMGERDRNDKLRLLYGGNDVYRYLKLGVAFGPAYHAQIDGRPLPSDSEREEIYANVGDLIGQANHEIDTQGLDRPENTDNTVRGSYTELVTIGASLHPEGSPLFPTPQRGYRRSDVQVPYRMPDGQLVDRYIDIKLGQGTGSSHGPTANRLRVGRIASAAVFPGVEQTSGVRADMAWTAMNTLGRLVAADSRGMPIDPDEQKMLGLFAWALPLRIAVINGQTGIADFLQGPQA